MQCMNWVICEWFQVLTGVRPAMWCSLSTDLYHSYRLAYEASSQFSRILFKQQPRSTIALWIGLRRLRCFDVMVMWQEWHLACKNYFHKVPHESGIQLWATAVFHSHITAWWQLASLKFVGRAAHATIMVFLTLGSSISFPVSVELMNLSLHCHILWNFKFMWHCIWTESTPCPTKK